MSRTPTPGRGRVVVVTGGTRGIGLGLARELLARDCRVVVCGRSPESLAAALEELGPQASGLVADISSREAVQAVWDHAVATFGRVDVWINNAGVSAPRRPLTEVSAQAAEAVVSTNLLGVLHGCAVALAGMAAQPPSEAGPCWIWTMEGFGSTGQKQSGMTTYGASKRAATYLTESLVKETRGGPVRIGLLSPGIVATDLLVADYAGQPEAFEKARKIFNILGDRVETVTPWLADRLLAADKHGVRIAWLTTPKAFARFAGAGVRKREVVGPELPATVSV